MHLWKIQEKPIGQTIAVDARYAAAAQDKEACLCTPVGFDPKYLEPLPSEVIERD